MPLKRKKTSRKGENGRVLVVGGSEVFHGAPILAGLGAEKSGADLIYLMVPKNQVNLTRQYSLNLIVQSFSGQFLRPRDVQKIVDWSEKADVLVIGNGLGERPQTLRACKHILTKTKCDLVVDASALAAFAEIKKDFGKRQLVLTPHRGELAKMTGCNICKQPGPEIKDFVAEWAKKWKSTLVLKGAEDIISDASGNLHINKSGHPIMTKGGTGDVLAGLIGGLLSQGLTSFEAAKEGTELWGKIGEAVYKKKGNLVGVEDLVGKTEQC